jgi:putative transferase (TIGR04331 family)
VFLSWGGTGEGVRPLPSPYLCTLRDRHRGGRRVLLVECIMPPDAYLIRFNTTPHGNQGYRQAEQLAEFVRSLGTARPHLFLKRFPQFIAGAERDPALAALPHRPPPTRRTAARLMMDSRLVVVPYPDTPFIESMVIGAPTIGIWEDELWNMRDDAQPPFDELRAAGVIFSDASAAAAHADAIYGRANEWWRSTDVQAARRSFLDRFALTGDWLAEWSSFLTGGWLSSAP